MRGIISNTIHPSQVPHKTMVGPGPLMVLGVQRMQLDIPPSTLLFPYILGQYLHSCIEGGQYRKEGSKHEGKKVVLGRWRKEERKRGEM